MLHADAFGSSSCILPFLSPCHSRIQSLLSCMRLDLPVRARICTRRANARIRTGGGPWMYFTITNEPRGTRTKPRHACARSPAIHRCQCLHPHSEWFVFIQTNLNGCGRWKSSHTSEAMAMGRSAPGTQWRSRDSTSFLANHGRWCGASSRRSSCQPPLGDSFMRRLWRCSNALLCWCICLTSHGVWGGWGRLHSRECRPASVSPRQSDPSLHACMHKYMHAVHTPHFWATASSRPSRRGRRRKSLLQGGDERQHGMSRRPYEGEVPLRRPARGDGGSVPGRPLKGCSAPALARLLWRARPSLRIDC